MSYWFERLNSPAGQAFSARPDWLMTGGAAGIISPAGYLSPSADGRALYKALSTGSQVVAADLKIRTLPEDQGGGLVARSSDDGQTCLQAFGIVSGGMLLPVIHKRIGGTNNTVAVGSAFAKWPDGSGRRLRLVGTNGYQLLEASSDGGATWVRLAEGFDSGAGLPAVGRCGLLLNPGGTNGSDTTGIQFSNFSAADRVFVQPGDLFDNDTSIAASVGGSYHRSSPGAVYRSVADATAVTVGVYINHPYDRQIGVRVNNADYATLAAPGTGLSRLSLALPAGTKTVDLVAGTAQGDGHGGAVTGVYLGYVDWDGASSVTPTAPVASDRLYILTDSIGCGSGATSAPLLGWPALVRANRGVGTQLVDGFGARTLWETIRTPEQRAAQVAKVVALAPSRVVVTLMLNDYLQHPWLAAEGAAALGLYFDDIHAAIPNQLMAFETALVIGSEGQNALGETLDDWREAIVAELSKRYFVAIKDGKSICDPADLAGDLVHPADSGHAKNATFWLVQFVPKKLYARDIVQRTLAALERAGGPLAEVYGVSPDNKPAVNSSGEVKVQGGGGTGNGPHPVTESGGSGATIDITGGTTFVSWPTDQLRYVYNGVGVPGLFVSAYSKAAFDASPGTGLSAQTQTKTDGRWVSPLGLDSGDYYIIADKTGDGFDASRVTIRVP